MCIRDSYYLYDAFEGVSYELDISKEPGHRIKNLKWPNGKAVKDTDCLLYTSRCV